MPGRNLMYVGLVSNFSRNTGSGRYAYGLLSALKDISSERFEILSCGETANDTIRGIKFPVYRTTLNTFLVYPRRIPRNYDIIHLTNQFLMNGARFSKNPIVTVLDTIILEYPGYPFLTRTLQKNALKSLAFAKQIISISDYTKQDLIRRGVDESRIETIYLGYNKQAFKEQDKAGCRNALGLPADKKIILHVGSEEPRKNVDKLLYAFDRVSKDMDDAILVRVGEKSKGIEKLANRLGLSDRIIHLRSISDDAKLSQIYNSADVFVFPSSYEGFGIPPLEAMACGTPVISSDKTSLKEVIGNAAVIIEPENVSDIAEKILLVLSSKALQGKLSAKGLNRAREFTWEVCAKKTLKVYEEAMQ